MIIIIIMIIMVMMIIITTIITLIIIINLFFYTTKLLLCCTIKWMSRLVIYSWIIHFIEKKTNCRLITIWQFFVYKQFFILNLGLRGSV